MFSHTSAKKKRNFQKKIMLYFACLNVFSINVSVNISVATSTPPRLNPDQEEHIYQSGSSFRLSCEATTPVDWKLPVLSVNCIILLKQMD